MTQGESVTSSEATGPLSKLVEESIAHATEVAKQLASHKETAILGLRSQIIDNVTVLLPYLKASKAISAATDNGATVHVITVGQEPAVRACVFSGGTDQPMKLIHAAEATDATSALSSLMKKTQCMLGSHFNYSAKASTKTTKVNSGAASITSLTSSLATTPVDSKVNNRPIYTFSTPAKSPISKLKAEAKGQGKVKVKHVREKSETGLFDAFPVNNKRFLETCMEPKDDGPDSGFLSRDGEPHPNRSYVNLAKVPVKVEEGDDHFF